MLQTKDQDKNSWKKKTNETDNVSDKELKAMVIKILIKLRKRIKEHDKNFVETWMDLQSVKQTEVSSERKKIIIQYRIYVESRKMV